MQQTQSEKLKVPGGGGGGSRERDPFNFTDLGIRLIGLAIIDALALWFAASIYSRENSPVIPIVLLLVTALINYIFLSKRLYPVRWLAPGLVMLLLMVIYPVGYNIYISFTTNNNGHALDKEQVVSQLQQATFGLTYELTAYRNASQQYKIILKDSKTGQYLIGDQSGVQPYTPPGGTVPNNIDDFTKLSPFVVAGQAATINKLNIQYNGLPIVVTSGSQATASSPKYTYDAASDKLTDNETKTVFSPVNGNFVSADGKTVLTPGFSYFAGFENYAKVFTSGDITGPFVGVFIWTFVFAFFSVFLTFSVGLGMALVLNDDGLPLRTLWRVLLFIPYTIPAFISSLVWAGLFSLYGPVDTLSKSLFGGGFSWFSDPNAAKVMLLFVNTWLGYPYMMLICLGALQSIPADIYEAATIDGANRVQKFFSLALPLLLVSVGPLLIGSFAFNFNNFGIIQLITQGGPADPTTTTPAGRTDILISYTYRLAFGTGKGQDLGLAATISLFIFIIIAAITTFSFRYTKQLEEVLN